MAFSPPHRDGVTKQLTSTRRVARDTEKEARDTLREISDKANKPAVEGFKDAVQQAGNSTPDKKGMWADLSIEYLVQYNDGFKSQLIGTPDQIAERTRRCDLTQPRFCCGKSQRSVVSAWCV